MDATVQQLLELIKNLREENKRQQTESQRLQKESQRQQKENQKLQKELLSIIAGLQSEIADLKQLLFQKKSEKRTRITKPKTKSKSSPSKIQKTRKAKREQQKSLPVETIKIPVEEEQCRCDCCKPEEFRLIGLKRIERIEFVPSVLKRYYYQLQSKKCQCGKTIVSSQTPANVVDGGRYGPGFHAHVVVSKVDDSLPLERQAKILGRTGVEINKSTLCEVFHRSAQLLSPIYDLFISRLQKSELVNADETTIKLQQPKQCKRAYMWSFLDADQIVYSFSQGRSGNKVLEVLSDSSGLLQSDGYSGYNKGNRQRIGCWAHVRRYFFKALANADAKLYFDWINDLYGVEYLAIERDEVGSKNHLTLRKLKSQEILDKMKTRLEREIGNTPPKSPFGRALTYLSNHWDSLQVFLTDPNIRLDNNLSERALRIIAVGRKNYLFVGSKSAGQNLAVLQSLVQTCKLHQVNPQEYLTDVLIRIQTHPQSEIESLHPKNWKQLGFGH